MSRLLKRTPAMSDDEYAGLPSTFAAACRKADAARRKLRPDPKTELLRRLMELGVSLDALRAADVAQLGQIAAGYGSRERFLTELTLDPTRCDEWSGWR